MGIRGGPQKHIDIMSKEEWGTGWAKAGETLAVNFHFLLKARPSQYLAFIIEWATPNAKKQIEEYIHKHSDAEFSHGICPNVCENTILSFWSLKTRNGTTIHWCGRKKPRAQFNRFRWKLNC